VEPHEHCSPDEVRSCRAKEDLTQSIRRVIMQRSDDRRNDPGQAPRGPGYAESNTLGAEDPYEPLIDGGSHGCAFHVK